MPELTRPTPASELGSSQIGSGADGSGQSSEGLSDRLKQEAAEYDQGHDQPLAGYAAAMGAFGTGWLIAGVAMRLTGRRLPDSYRTSDLLIGGMAVHKLTRIISKEAVASPLRMPFTRFTGEAHSAELHEEMRATGALRSLGELITCPFCLAPWLASTYVITLATAPRAARSAAAVFAMVFGSDVLQHAYTQLKEN